MKISEETARQAILDVFDYYWDSLNENGRFWTMVQTKKCQVHYDYESYTNRKGERKQRRIDTCYNGENCEGRWEKKYTPELGRMSEARNLALRQVENFFDFKKERKRLERNGETKELGGYDGFGIIRDPFQE